MEREGGFCIRLGSSGHPEVRPLEPAELPWRRIADLERQLRTERENTLRTAKEVQQQTAAYWQEVARREREQGERVLALLYAYARRKVLPTQALREALEGP
jgi:hypothetical protein